MCDCVKIRKKKENESLKIAISSARLEMESDKKDYLVYKYENKIYYDAKECWEKDGKKGEVITILYFV